MFLAPLLLTAKTVWSLLVAASLIWSGIGLAGIPSEGDSAFPDAANSVEVLKLAEDLEDQVAQPRSLASGAPPLGSRAINDVAGYFDPDAEYRILTRYGSATEIALADFLADGISGVAFSLVSCDESRSDYYRSVAVQDGKLKLESNTLGHVHGSNAQTETVCTVSATGGDGDLNQDFSLYTVSDRTPSALPAGALTVAQARADEIDIQVDMPGNSLGYIRLGWRVSGSQPSFAVARGVTDDTVLTITGLQADSSYEIRAYLMTAQAFDLYRSSNTGAAGTLITEGNPASKWISNLTGSGLGKSESITQSTLPAPPPMPDPVPDETPEATLAPTSRPTPDVDDEDDDDDLNTPTPTDNDGIDTPTPTDGIDTPTPTDNDGTDSDGVDTTALRAVDVTDNDGTDSDGIDTPTPVSPDTPTPVSPDTPTPVSLDTPTPVSPDTPTPVSPDTLTPVSPDTLTPVSPDTPTPVSPDTPTPVSPDTPTPVSPDTPTPVSPDTLTPVSPDTLTPVTPDTPTPSTVSPVSVSDEDDSDDS